LPDPIAFDKAKMGGLCIEVVLLLSCLYIKWS